MRRHAQIWFLVLLTGVLVAFSASAAQAAPPETTTLVAVNCKAANEKCASTETALGAIFGPEFGEQTYVEPNPPKTKKESEEEGFLQAGGRVPFGITDFKVPVTGKIPTAVPNGVVEHLRTDVAAGLATNPTAVPQCTMENFGDKEVAPGSGAFLPSNCPGSQIGKQHATVFVDTRTKTEIENKVAPHGIDVALVGTVYNLVPAENLASEFGVAVELPPGLTGGAKGLFAHTLIEGNVEWGKQANGTGEGDYHDYFEINVSPALPLISSRLDFEGTNGTGDFVTNATSCPGHNTTSLKLTYVGGATEKAEYTTLVGLHGCSAATEKDELGETFTSHLPFEPKFALTSGSTVSDSPNQITTEVSLTHDPKAVDQSQVKTASIKLPEGLTLNPSAAHGLEACTVAQAHIHAEAFGVECPAGSELGTVNLEVPTLPAGSLTGTMYLGGPVTGSETAPISGPPYIIYVVANSKRYGVSVRIKGEVIPNEATGQLTTVFNENPEQPFSSLILHFNRGALTSVANPLVCGSPTGSTSFTPVTGEPASKGGEFGVPVTGCGVTIPFALTQEVEYENKTAGAHTAYAFGLARADGQQYLEKVKTSLPLGVVGEIPTVTQCAEAQANAGTCPSSSKIGTATVQSGSGSAPITNNGNVYLTEKYAGAPYGLSIVVPAVAGPFNLGNVVTRSTINIDQKTARVTAESTLPTIVKGIPLRLRSLNVNINRQGFALNPTNCAVQPEGTSSTLTSTFGGIQSPLNTPFQVEGCGSLGFKPTFAASTSGKPTKNTGASLVTNITMPGGNANIKSVKVTLPKQLPSRGSTLQKACLEAVFAINPFACSNESMVGTATVVTPTLPGKMKGPAYLVSHGGAGFPNLELVLEDQGVRVILEGQTDIKNGITTTTFASSPDVPVTSVEVNLPQGPHSALGAFGSLCKPSLVIPTTIVGQNGKTFKQNTPLKPTGCGVQIVGSKIVGNTAYLTVKTFAAGRISGSGHGACNACIKQVARTLNGATNAASLKVHLSNFGASKHKPFKTQIRVGFLPKKKGPHSQAYITVTFH